jgi:hypothetical protein
VAKIGEYKAREVFPTLLPSTSQIHVQASFCLVISLNHQSIIKTLRMQSFIYILFGFFALHLAVASPAGRSGHQQKDIPEVPFKPPPHSCNPCGTRLKP